MNKCKINELFNKSSFQNLEQETELLFNVVEQEELCRKVNLQRDVSIYEIAQDEIEVDRIKLIEREGVRKSFDRFIKPTDVSCMPKGCSTSGTLTVKIEDNAPTNSMLLIEKQITLFDLLQGGISFYSKIGFENATIVDDGLNNMFIFKSSDKSVYINADFKKEIIPIGNGMVYQKYSFLPLLGVTDPKGLLALPLETVLDVGIALDSELTPINALEPMITSLDLSTLFIIDDISVFGINDVVALHCMSALELTNEFTITENVCSPNRLDSSGTGLTLSITAGLITPNYWLLNPLASKPEYTFSCQPDYRKRVIEKDANSEFGIIKLTDYCVDECGYFKVQIADSCDVSDTEMELIDIKNVIGGNQVFKEVIGDEVHLFFNNTLIGTETLIMYPIEVEVKRITLTNQNLNTRVTRLRFKANYDSRTMWFIFENVVITTFPFSFANENEFNFTFDITINKDSNGKYGTIEEIVV